MEEKKEMSVLELPLIGVEPWQADRINKKMDNCVKIYNTTRKRLLTRLNQLQRTRAFKEDSRTISVLRDITTDNDKIAEFHEERCKSFDEDKKETGKTQLEELKGKDLSVLEFVTELRKIPLEADVYLAELDVAKKGLSKEDKKMYTEKLKELYGIRNSQYKEIGLTRFGVIDNCAEAGKYFVASVPSNMCSNSVAKPLWAAFDKLLFGNGDKVAFKRFGDTNSIATDGKSGMVLKEKDGKPYLLFSNGNKAKKMWIRIKSPSTDYERDMFNRKVKIIRLVRRLEKTKYHYYVQLTVEGSPYIKTDNDGNELHKIGTGEVSMSVWREQMYTVSENGTNKYPLVLNEAAYVAKRDELARKIEELRRLNNPNNYEEDGTIKRGIIVDGVKKRLVWHNSLQYKELVKEKRELERKHKINRDLLHRKIAYDVLEKGSAITFIKTSFKTNKPEFNEDERLSSNEYRKKKERRKSIQETAPSNLKAKINSKLSSYGLGEIKEIKIPDELYWYRFDTDTQDKNALNGEYITIMGKTCPHTAYRAFILKYYDEETKSFDQKAISDNWDDFIAGIDMSIDYSKLH